MKNSFFDTLYLVRHSGLYSDKQLPEMPPNPAGVEYYYNSSRPGRKIIMNRLVSIYDAFLGPSRIEVDGMSPAEIEKLSYSALVTLYESLKRDHKITVEDVVKSSSSVENKKVQISHQDEVNVLIVSEEKLSEYEDWLVEFRRKFDEELQARVNGGSCSRCARTSLFKKYAAMIEDAIESRKAE